MKNSIKFNLLTLAILLVCTLTFFESKAQIVVTNGSEIYVNGTVLYSKGAINLETESATIYLRNGAQLVQADLINSNQGLGKISVYQEGTAHQFAYNYWCSPVGSNNANTAINNPFRINQLHDPLVNTTNPIDSQNAIFTGNYNGTSNPLTIAKPWLYTFTAGSVAGNWNFVGDTGWIAPGLGFSMKGTSGSNNNQAYDFRGKPNNGKISNAVAASQWTLIGNPYPSALDALAFIHDADNVNAITGSLYFWEQDLTILSHVTADYVGGYASYTISSDGTVETFTPAPFNTYNSNGTINNSGNPTTSSSGKAVKRFLPIGQGFMVEGKSGTTGVVTTKNSHRAFYKESDSESEFFKSSTPLANLTSALPTNYKRFRINLDFGNNYTRQLVQTFHSNATTGFDYGLESKCLNILSSDAYWETNSVFYISQALSFSPQVTVPITIKISADTSVRFRLFDVQNFDANQSIYLYDNSNGNYYDLSDANLELNLAAGLYTNRFEIRFVNSTLSLEDETVDNNNLNVFYKKTTSQIQIINQSNLVITKLELYDLSGKMIFFKEINSDSDQIIVPIISVATGIYLCKIISNTNEKSVTKLYIN